MRKNYPLVIKKRLPYLIFLLVFQIGISQEVALRKGVIIDSVQVDDENNETFSLYLPTNFVTSKKWPVLYVFDMDGKGRQAMSMFKQAAEAKGYILASPDNINDTLSLSENMLRVGRAIDGVSRLLPIQNERLYVAGFAHGARFANITPLFLNKISADSFGWNSHLCAETETESAFSIPSSNCECFLLNLSGPAHAPST